MLFSALLGALASPAVSIEGAAHGIWTEGRPGMVAKLYGDVGLLRLGLMTNRGQVLHSTRLDGFVGLSARPMSALEVSGGVQLGALLPDPPCRSGCRDWEHIAAGSEEPVGYGRLTLGLTTHPTPSSTVEVLWQTSTFPRFVGFRDPELLHASPLLLLVTWPLQNSSLFVDQTLVRRGPTRLGLLVEARGSLWVVDELLKWDNPGVHENGFGPRAGGGLSLGAAGVITAEITAGVALGWQPYATAGVRFGRRRENALW